MKYTVTGMGSCDFVYYNYANSEYSAKIILKLVMFKELLASSYVPGMAVWPVNETVLTFWDIVPSAVVPEETQEKVSINLPVNSFDIFYKMLCEAIYEKKYRLDLNIIGKGDMTLAKFEFIQV